MTSLAPTILDEDVLLSDADPSYIASGHSPVTEQELRKYLVAFGGESTSYFHLQDGVDYFHLRGIGFMSYREERTLLHRMRFVFAKPVCADEHLDLLLDKFMAWNDVETVFLSADAAFAKRLSARGYRVNDMGSDFIIPLDTFKISGRKMRHLKAARNLVKHGLRVEERDWGVCGRRACLGWVWQKVSLFEPLLQNKMDARGWITPRGRVRAQRCES